MTHVDTIASALVANLREEIRREERAAIMTELRNEMTRPEGRRWIDQTAVARKLDCSVRQLHRIRREGDFPRPKAGPKWFEDEIDAWMDRRNTLPY